MPTASSDRFETPKFRILWADLETVDKYGKYTIKAAFDMDDIKEMKAVEMTVAKEQFGGAKPEGYRSPFSDGNLEVDKETGKTYPSCVDKMIVRFSTRQKPVCIAADGKTPVQPEELYSGAYACIRCNAFGYDMGENKGVSFGLDSIQFWEKGEALGGGREDPTKVFGAKGGSRTTPTPKTETASTDEEPWS